VARTYCDGVANGTSHAVHRPYHDREYGFPVVEDSVLFERLVLEIHQAGLSWELILRKRDGYRRAFENFDPARVARFDERDVERLAADAGIVRNRMKIRAAIHNAGVVVGLARSHGSFARWLDAHHPMAPADWLDLFRRTFRFMGPEIVGEFLMSTGYLPGAHEPDCPAYAMAIAAGAPWARVTGAMMDATPR